MVLNYLPGGELFYRLKREGRFSVERVRLYGAQIALGLGAPFHAPPVATRTPFAFGIVAGHLHSLDMIYRDLKPGALTCLLPTPDQSPNRALCACREHPPR